MPIPLPTLDIGKITNRKLEITDDFTDFHCDLEDELGCDDFIHNEKEAKLFQKERQGITYLFFYEKEMVGYVTLAMSSIPAKRMEGRFKKRVSLNFYPSLLVGRLAVRNTWREKGIGAYLCDWSLGVALVLSEKIGCRYVILETIKKKVGFYAKCGFHEGKVLEEDNETHAWMFQKIDLDSSDLIEK